MSLGKGSTKPGDSRRDRAFSRGRFGQGQIAIIGISDEKKIEELEFELSIRRSVKERIERGFSVHTYKPVLDDEPYRIFDSTSEYRRWCEENLPDWLGYGAAD